MQDLNILENQHPYSKKVYPGEDIVKKKQFKTIFWGIKAAHLANTDLNDFVGLWIEKHIQRHTLDTAEYHLEDVCLVKIFNGGK